MYDIPRLTLGLPLAAAWLVRLFSPRGRDDAVSYEQTHHGPVAEPAR